MRSIWAGSLYFLSVFAAGFLLALLRVPFLVPWLGVRWAELLEMPLMLVVIVLAARHWVRRFGPLTQSQRWLVGLFALLLLATAELALAAALQGLSPAAYVASRDPVSGSVYAAMLMLFALLPAALGPSRTTRPAAGRRRE